MVTIYSMAAIAWILLSSRLPREPSRLRLAIWRRLKRLGAVLIHDAVWMLPADAKTREAFEWLAEEIEEQGGTAWVWEAAGLSADYVFRETKRALNGVAGTKCKIYPGIDIDIPTEANQKKTSPDDVYAATTAGLKAGADGILFSRKYSEMKLANLSAGGKAVQDAMK